MLESVRGGVSEVLVVRATELVVDVEEVLELEEDDEDVSGPSLQSSQVVRVSGSGEDVVSQDEVVTTTVDGSTVEKSEGEVDEGGVVASVELVDRVDTVSVVATTEELVPVELSVELSVEVISVVGLVSTGVEVVLLSGQ